MSLIEQITASAWTVVASQVFDDGHYDTGWFWKCDHREAGEITTRMRDGRIISAQRKIGPGKYELVVRLPKYPPRLPAPPPARTVAPANRPKAITDYDKLLQRA